jgi:hypothetical protein
MSMVQRYAALFGAVALALLAPRLAAAAPVGTFTKIEGSVDMLRRSDTAAVRVKTGDRISMGDAIRTKRDSKAEITFLDATVVQLGPETRITIDEYTYQGGMIRAKALIGLYRGKIRSIVSKLKTAVVTLSRTDASFSIKTPTAIVGVKGTEFIVYYERGITGIIFIDGDGAVYNPSKPGRIVKVTDGQASFVMSAEEAPLDAQPVADSFVAPHLKDMPVSNREYVRPQPDNGPPPAADGKQLPPISVVMANTTYEALTDAIAGSGGSFGLSAAPASLIIGDPAAPLIGPPGGVTNLIPITQVYPSLLPTPVSLSVTIP